MSSLQHVTDPRAVHLLLHPRVQRVLGPFLHQPATCAAVARETSLDLRVVHRDVQALLAAGLLTEVRREARSGRAIRHYSAAADGFFILQALTPDADYAERFEQQFLPVDRLLTHAAGRTMQRALDEQAQGREWGQRVFWDGATLVVDESWADAERRDVLSGWQGPQVTAFNGLSVGPLLAGEAQEVQTEFVGLMTRLNALFEQNRAAGRGTTFAVRAVLTPVSSEDLTRLHV